MRNLMNSKPVSVCQMEYAVNWCWFHWWLVWRCGDGVCHINEVKLSPVSTGIGDLWRVYHSDIYPDHSGPLSLAIPAWVGAISTAHSFQCLYWSCIKVWRNFSYILVGELTTPRYDWLVGESFVIFFGGGGINPWHWRTQIGIDGLTPFPI